MKKIAILSDFSKTLTYSSNPTTWSVFAKSWLLWEEYIKERNKNYEENYHFEVEWNKEKTADWFKQHMLLFAKYWLTLDLIKKIVRDEKYFKPRKWLEIFLNKIFSKEIEIFIITSSWVTNFIEEFLKFNNISIEKIDIVGNILKIDNSWKVVWCEDTIITPLNKWDYSPDLSNFEKVILLWDDWWDLLMAKSNKYLKIGFCDKEKISGYDVYLGKEGSLEEVLEYIN